MGKKRVIKQTKEEALKETKELEGAEKKAQNRAGVDSSVQDKITTKMSQGCAYVQSTYNNTVVTITDTKGHVLVWASAGSVGFKGPRKATPYAAAKVIEFLMEKINRIGIREISVFVKGVGSGRESAVRALAAQGLEINMIKDVTPIPHNGCRPPKIRRV